MIVAKIQVNGAIAKTVYRKVIPAGIIGAQVEFDYAEDIWHGLHKTVVFKGAVTKDVITDANIVTIPHEVVEKPFFRLSIGVYGVDADGNIAIPTLWEDIGAILDSAAPSGDISTDPSLPVWAQIQAMIGNLDELETTARDNLVAAVNEVAQSGGGGSASIAMRVYGGYIQYSTDNGKTWVNLIAEADLKGDKGDKGDKGAPGTPGKDGDDGHTPVKGTDYWTASDKAEVVAEAAAAVDLTPYAKKTEVPTKTSQLTNDSGFLTSHQDISGKQDKITSTNKLEYSLISGTPTIPTVPTNVSAFTNDAGYITPDQLSDVVSVADIVDNLTTNVSNKPLSAAQGVALKTMLDAALGAYITDIDALVGGDG